MFLSNFQILRPPFETKQEKALEWLIEAHLSAKKSLELKEAYQTKLYHVGCKPSAIEKRGHVLPDFLHQNWDEMLVYNLRDEPLGKDLESRTEIYKTHVDAIFENFYKDVMIEPNDLIHVSCTGYASPSGAQKLVSNKGWGQKTTVTHAYHMGCYASVPALRMGMGFLSADQTKARVDVVHTELCTLHSNPISDRIDHLVSQTLFADGFAKYEISPMGIGPALKVLSIHEEIIPHSIDAMKWDIGKTSFVMTLAKEIPVLIARHLEGFINRLGDLKKDALFAIHPGGPKILSHIQKLLKLNDTQLAYSYEVLKAFGNMSSATLPHIWKNILKDPNVKENTQIVSLAFGPGLTIAGIILEKVCGS